MTFSAESSGATGPLGCVEAGLDPLGEHDLLLGAKQGDLGDLLEVGLHRVGRDGELGVLTRLPQRLRLLPVLPHPLIGSVLTARVLAALPNKPDVSGGNLRQPRSWLRGRNQRLVALPSSVGRYRGLQRLSGGGRGPHCDATHGATVLGGPRRRRPDGVRALSVPLIGAVHQVSGESRSRLGGVESGGMDAATRVLVLANRTADSRELRQRLLARHGPAKAAMCRGGRRGGLGEGIGR